MDTNPFDPRNNEDDTTDHEATTAEPAGQQAAVEPPTNPGMEPATQPGLDPTAQPGVQPLGQPGPAPAGIDTPAQPKWQPLPGGAWAPPSAQAPPAPPAAPTGYGTPGYGTEGYGAAGYGTPGYGTPGYGTPGYGAPGSPSGPGFGYGGSAYGAPDPGEQPPRRSHSLRNVLVGLAVALLIAGAASAGAVIGHNTGSTTGTTTALGTIPNPPPKSNSTSATKLDVSKIAKQVDRATVDITSVLGTQNAVAEGTGMVLTSSGEVLTNNHVIEGATKITAQVDGKGQKFTVKVLGADPTDDVALVLLEGASGLPTVSVGNSSAVSVGDPVVAIGNALGLGGTPTVTSGIVSALSRSINATDAGTSSSEHLTGLIQTDAPINPGNSGGPLVNANGQVIGMDTAALTGSGTQSASNIGFAIPINRALGIAQQIQQGKASSTILIGTHGILGVDVESIQAAQQGTIFGSGVRTPVNYGAYVAQVLRGSPAANAGIAAGDVITALNGSRISTAAALGQSLQGDHAGKSVSVTWVDGSGTSHTSSLTLVAGPAV